MHEVELDRYLRGAFRRTAWSLALLFVALVCVGALFEAELLAAAQWTERAVGVAGLAGFVFIADSFTLPLPPDLALIVVANSARRNDWMWIVPLLGCVSAVGGVLGWWFGTRLSATRWVRRIKEQMERRQSALLTRYGGLAVAVGALTPVPFSVTCWTVGALGLPFRTFILPCCLRVPRFVAYYWVLANATRASAWLGSLFGG